MLHNRNQLIGTFFLFILSLLAVIFHIGLASFFLYPLNKINFISLFVIIILLISESGKVVWLSFAPYFLIELFSITPFGVVLYSGTVSALIAFWLYKSVFTNRTILTTMSLTALLIFIYRFFYSILLFAYSYLSKEEKIIFSLPMSSYGWELAITVIAAALVHFLLKFFVPKLNTAKIKR